MPEENKEEIIIEEDSFEKDGAEHEEKIKKIKKELSQCLKEKSEYLAGWQRAKADFINTRKEEEKSRGEFKKFANKNLLLEFLEVADSFEIALNDKTGGAKSGNKWIEGMEGIYKQILKILEKHGIEEIQAKGNLFNPAEHEAIAEENVNDEAMDKTVIEEMQKGYKMRGETLRPAKVKVGVYKK